MQSVRPVLIGFGTTFVLIMMLYTFSGVFWPPPAGINLNDPQALRMAQEAAPLIAKIWGIAIWFVAVLCGAFLARKVAGGINTLPSWMIGGVFTFICVFSTGGGDIPLWMHLASVAMPLPAAWLGLTLAAHRVPVAPQRP